MPPLPRFIRLSDAPAYLGMDKNRFNDEVRPTLIEIPIGKTGIAFDRYDLDNWAYCYAILLKRFVRITEMKHIILLVLLTTVAHADEYYTTRGDLTVGSEGTIIKRVGNVYHDLNTGIDYTRTDAGILGSDGSSAIVTGNVIHNGDGTTCITVRNVTQCE